jgi:hypothetical protein
MGDYFGILGVESIEDGRMTDIFLGYSHKNLFFEHKTMLSGGGGLDYLIGRDGRCCLLQQQHETDSEVRGELVRN